MHLQTISGQVSAIEPIWGNQARGRINSLEKLLPKGSLVVALPLRAYKS
jgi:hypothetical protein